ncbi:MAG: hypothetical protein FWH17_02135 [Oscillospiraceae bacterium]|nr:hypothetical protein [Oscillospiraceae bacterium]
MGFKSVCVLSLVIGIVAGVVMGYFLESVGAGIFAFFLVTFCVFLIITGIVGMVKQSKGEMATGQPHNAYVSSEPEIPQEKLAQQDDVVKCPKCGSTQISANKKGFGVGKAVVGVATFGSLGLIAGNIGAKKVRITCLKCGNSWLRG